MLILRRLVFLFLTLCLLTTGALASEGGYVALTFDDGPSGSNTKALLEMLEEKEVTATFFLCGYRMESFPSLVEALKEAGHELGVHGYSHTCFDVLCQAELQKELQETGEQIRALTGTKPVLLRPPCGAWNEMVRQEAREEGMTVILWSVDSLDWKRGDTGEMAQRVCSQAENGDIILMHDMYRESIDAAARIIDTLRARGYEFVSVSELAALADCNMEPGNVFSQFSGAHSPEAEKQAAFDGSVVPFWEKPAGLSHIYEK